MNLLSCSRLRVVLHVCGALLLVLFAIAKGAALIGASTPLYHQNPVFPFLTNSVLYTVSVLVDVGAAWACLRFAGRNRADYCLLFFVAIMAWYKAALHFNGGLDYGCGCLGLLGNILHLDGDQESTVSSAALLVLLVCASPGPLSRVAVCTRVPTPRKALAFLLSLSLLYFVPLSAETIEIRGHYSHQAYNGSTGKPYTNVINGIAQGGDYSFRVLLTDPSWKISVTNSENSGLWTELVYDGTNTITVAPHGPPFVLPSQTITNASFVTISTSAYYLPYVSDWAYASVPWLTFGLRPPATDAGNVQAEIPLPWETPRRKPLAYGWRWDITPSEAGRFIASCRVVRDAELDLKQSAELLRWELNYPEDVRMKNRYLDLLRGRREIRSGFVDTAFQSTSWRLTNGVALPTSSELSTYSYGNQFPRARASLTVDSIQFHQGEIPIAPDLVAQRSVQDYRYKRSNRSRIYKYAEYTLEKGESWKGADDPALLQQAADFLEHGPKYNYYDYNYRVISAWVLGAILVVTPLILTWMKRKTVKHQLKG